MSFIGAILIFSLQQDRPYVPILLKANSYGAAVQGKVLNERFDTHWMAGRYLLWTRTERPNRGSRYQVLDSKSKKLIDAFDHDRLAKSLAKSLSKPFDADRLPLANLEIEPDLSKIKFRLDKNYTVNLSTYELTDTATTSIQGLKAWHPDEVRESGGGGEQTSIGFVNQSKENLKIWWIQDDGGIREYKTLAPAESWSISTWETHYWLVTRTDGTRLAVYKPSLNGGVANLDGAVAPRSPRQNARQGNTSPDGTWRISIQPTKLELDQAGEKWSIENPTPDPFEREVHFSQDSKHALLFVAKPEFRHPLNIVQTTPPDQFQPKLTARQYLKPGDDIEIRKPVLLAKGGKSVIPLPTDLIPNPFTLDVAWVDNEKLILKYNQRGHQIMRLVEFNIATKAARVLIDEQSKTFIDWTAKSWHQIIKGGKEALWQTERSGWSHIVRYDLETGQVKNEVTKGNWVMRGVDLVDEDKQQIWFRASGLDSDQDPYQVHFCRVNFDGSGFTRLTRSNGNHRVEFSPDRKYIVDTYSRPDMPPKHELRDAESGALISNLGEADASGLSGTPFKLPKVIVAKGRDGKTDIWGHVYFPADYDPTKKYPVVEDIYAGPHSAHVPKNFHVNAGGMQFAQLGFIVVRIDGMGTSNRSKAFHDVCWKNIVDAGFPDRILWMKEAAKSIPSMDLNRVGIYGTSAGGQNTLHALLTHPEFYKVGVADCGCYDNRMDKIWWNEQWMGWPIGPHYEAQSGRTLAKNLQGKLMLLLGEMDTNVDPASTYQVVDALQKADKDFDFITIPNWGHGAIGNPFARRRAMEFLIEHLKPDTIRTK